MPEWIVAGGHVLNMCAFIRSLNRPWEPEEECDCQDLQQDDGRDDDGGDDDG